jgi:hypothetical protein
VVVGAVVLVWAWLSPVIAGAAIGGIAWMCVTGFDVNRFGEIRITGRDDVLRAVTLVLAGALAAVAHAAAETRRSHRTVDPLWAEFHQTHPATDGLEPNRITIGLGAPRPRERALPVRPTEEPRDG